MDPSPLPRILPRCRDTADRPRGPAPLRVVGPTHAIDPARCNRCGACLRLGCGAISDLGGDALVVNAAACDGCAACQPVCRSRAIAPAGSP